MRPAVIILCLAISGLAIAHAPSAHAASAEDELTAAIVAFGRGDIEGSLVRLDAAASGTSDPALLAKIHRQRGIVFEVRGRRLDAVIEFLRAFYFNPQVELPKREHRGGVAALFACARAMYDEGVKEAAVATRWPKVFEPEGWTCPLPRLKPSAEPAIVAAAPPPAATEDSGWGTTILWIALGAVAVGGAVAAGVLLSAGGDPYGGNTDTVIVLSGDE